ncbi:MAG: class I SAM-dependent methyltransferase [Arenimonas sp.]|uniref:class I SAM-dependent methyltransferase n=1 Tax=Arenimonas sp. TaxID=1872635 RepID=UPI0025C56D3D|nr:class I SAM-dependent methyltransferase [Arenimonas sp.]MBW8366586.1 class I SAM-dependent methyltransferase [Arenimonas sp.]
MAPAADDPALETLFLPLVSGAVAWPRDGGGTLFLRARAGAALDAARGQVLVCEQSFKPWADALAASGQRAVDAEAGRFERVLLLAPRQRMESRALLARAVAQAAPGGVVVACAANNEGARSMQADLAQLAGPLHSLSKRHCRVCWTAPLDAAVDQALLAQWLALDAPRPIEDGRFLSRPGLFAWDRIDAASALLASCLPPDLAGRCADLGAGFGYLSSEVLARCPAVTALDLYEAEARALALARHNLAAARVPVGFHWHDVTTGLPETYDAIVSNPPFHQGRADDPGLGLGFIAAAQGALRPGGRLWLVANRHLPYEAALSKGFARVHTVREGAGFKVIEAIKESGK